MTETEQRPTREEAKTIDMVWPILTSLAAEMRELSKKKQEGILSELKVRQLNRVLADVKNVLKRDPSAKYLDLLDEDALPQNSDAVIVLAQWEAAVQQFKQKHRGYHAGEYVWFLRKGQTMEAQRNI